jgi:integrase
MAKRSKRKPKNPHGMGGYSERSDGRGYDVYIRYQTLEGKRDKRTTVKTEAEAKKRLNRWRHEIDEGILPSIEADTITVGHYLDLWLQTIKGTVSRHTYKEYEGKVRLHLKPTLGKIRLKNLTRLDVQRLLNQKIREGLSPRSVEYIHTTLSKALNAAVDADLARKNVAARMQLPQKQHSEKRVLTAEQVRHFFDIAAEAKDRFYALYVMAFTTGLRRGELLGLKWSDIDLDRGIVRVQRSLDTYAGPATERAPKREASRRSVKLLPEAVAALELHRRRQLEDRLRVGPRWEDHDYVFPSSRGTPMSGDNLVRRNLKPLLEKAGLPSLTFHELRHTFASLSFAAREHPGMVQKILGHSSIVQTMDTYSHLVPGMADDAAERFGGYLFGGEQ